MLYPVFAQDQIILWCVLYDSIFIILSDEVLVTGVWFIIAPQMFIIFITWTGNYY